MADRSNPVNSPYENDIADQPRALRALLQAPVPDLTAVRDSGFERIVLTGMGSSHYAGYSSWRTLLGSFPTWWLPTSELLDAMELVDDTTLVWITSHSGASGEVVELLRRLAAGRSSHTILATTKELGSPLGRAADVVLDLHCGDEHTVSTKSYLNTLVVHALASRQLAGLPIEQVLDEVAGLPEVIQSVLDDPLPETVVAALAEATSIAMVGGIAGGITAQTGALITKESAKIAAEGYVGGAFRHGPYEMAGRPELAVVVFTADAATTTTSLRRLCDDLVARGTQVIAIGPEAWPGTTHVLTPASGGELTQLMTGILRVQQLTVRLARRAGLVPGAFFHGQKVTSAL